MLHIFEMGDLLTSVGQEAIREKAVEVYPGVSKVAGWVSGVWKEFVETMEDGCEEM